MPLMLPRLSAVACPAAVMVTDTTGVCAEPDIRSSVERPAGVHGDFPELEQADWDAVLRVVTMILTALESEPLLETGPE